MRQEWREQMAPHSGTCLRAAQPTRYVSGSWRVTSTLTYDLERGAEGSGTGASPFLPQHRPHSSFVSFLPLLLI